MNKILSSVTVLALSGNFLIAGSTYMKPTEPVIAIAKEKVVVVDDVDYNGFFAGAAVSTISMNEAVLSTGRALTIAGGYYLNKYYGIEARYTRTLGDVDVDTGRYVDPESNVMSNMAIYFKPMYSLTTGFSIYGLAGYGKSTYETNTCSYSVNGVQWGLGAKYELANGVGIFFDYLDIHSDDQYDGLEAENILFKSLNMGATYTF